jgi:hypothetical protein
VRSHLADTDSKLMQLLPNFYNFSTIKPLVISSVTIFLDKSTDLYQVSKKYMYYYSSGSSIMCSETKFKMFKSNLRKAVLSKVV